MISEQSLYSEEFSKYFKFLVNSTIITALSIPSQVTDE
jgi:hypothetical protein